MSFFETRHLTKHFGGLTAVNDVSFQVEQGEIYGLIGPNGSGKTTLFNLITGYYPISSGTILFEGQPLNGLPTWKICKHGVGRTFQIVNHPTDDRSENVLTSAFNRTGSLPQRKRPWRCSNSAN
jgi:branched-chain amino acid transport system ATP-binding protein